MAEPLTLADFQRHISQRYEAADRARGPAATFVLLMEEVGELARALHRNDKPNLEEEFADVFAWLCTLANITNVDLTAVVQRKYFGDHRPQGVK